MFSVQSFAHYYLAIVVVGIVAGVCEVMFHRLPLKVVILTSGLLLSSYAGAVLFFNIPNGIAEGYFAPLFSFIFGLIWTLLWSMHFWENRKEA